VSSSAKADDPVHAGVEIKSKERGVLDRPVKPGDDSGRWRRGLIA
jgi:hypothetical protein